MQVKKNLPLFNKIQKTITFVNEHGKKITMKYPREYFHTNRK